MRIAVLCNDRVALPALDYLIGSGLVVAVAMPDRIHETQIVVKNKCVQANIPFQLFNKKNFGTAIVTWLNEYKADTVLVKTFPFLIPAEALAIPEYGFINFHYAPLPGWRGSNPLFWMLRNGAREGGVTVHEMTANYDEGAILSEQILPIAHNINFGILSTQLAYVGLQLTIDLINKLSTATLHRKEQDHSKAKWYSHPKPSDLFIDWQTMKAEEIAALVKACNPWNKGAGTRWKGWPFGITYASVTDNAAGEKASPGTILSIDSGTGFTIASKDGKVIVAEVVYCEEGFYPGYCLSAFGLQKHDQLS
ncbi:MAG: formyltransferase family protein [Bacteroidota bacterium]|nr:formyltransferase family protein [Bacteroidota bacterium]